MYTVKSYVFMYIRWKMPQISKSDMIETIVLNMHTVFYQSNIKTSFDI